MEQQNLIPRPVDGESADDYFARASAAAANGIAQDFSAKAGDIVQAGILRMFAEQRRLQTEFDAEMARRAALKDDSQCT